MKGRSGKKMESPKSGDKEYDQDLKSKPERRDNETMVENASMKKKGGGRTVRKSGGRSELKVGGVAARANGGRAPRKSGGRTGCDQSPFSSARSGTAPKGHKVTLID